MPDAGYSLIPERLLMQKITPCLWFDNNAEEAVRFYTSVFKNSKTGAVTHYGKNAPMPEGRSTSR